MMTTGGTTEGYWNNVYRRQYNVSSLGGVVCVLLVLLFVAFLSGLVLRSYAKLNESAFAAERAALRVSK